jgi:folate-dependent phosphoribosylglycinamide formyltransferase PurN
LEGHPRGNYALLQLLKAGFRPELVIEESSALAKKNRDTLLRDIGDSPLCPSTETVLRGSDVRRILVANHNDAECKKAISSLEPELTILGDTRILHPQIFGIAGIGTVNIHPGYLPVVRGNTPYLWAVYHDLPQGCTAHYVDEGIDTGSILVRNFLSVSRVRSYRELLVAIQRCCAETAVEALTEHVEGRVASIPQDKMKWEEQGFQTFRLAPRSVKAAAIAKIEESIGGYKLPKPRTR